MKKEKRESILSAARQMFGRYGIQKTNIDELARMAKVAKATLYNYFGGKDQIYTEVLNREANDRLQQIISVVEQTRSPLDKLRCFIKIKYKQMKDRANIINLPIEGGPYQLLPKIISIREKIFNREIQILRAILEEGIQEGIFYVDNALQSARAIGYALRGFEFSSLLEQDNKSIDDDIDRFYTLICNGLKVGKGGI
ncbi:MAG: TetR/AcrR family transcriptional regulator [Deltaproteobacteria bacterium]|nr:TetR/AcrR family transcriptional regulator [Deltaproteobacteria bacterium]